MNALVKTTTPVEIALTSSDIRRILIGASSDNARANLCQVRFEGAELAVVTDGHRLHIIGGLAVGLPEGEAVCVRRDVLEAAMGICDNVAIETCQRGTVIRAGRVVITDGRDAVTFPPYQQLLSHRRRATASWSATATAMRKALRGVIASDNGAIVLTETGPEDGESRTAGPTINKRYVEEAIKAAALAKGDKITIEWYGDLEPITVKAPGFEGVIMPMRR